ncbi:MBL fold metallo-hydrolase [Sphingomicrobium nitratireducens]|uniref:MBL fold metallo-hydrolase n=1 Tax=Sphingomicrobium nitratireducens TaxID=2964666 RepID=UPI00224088C2|nr:MBL fold metallo-hydrolase [Sphingomicrobium nitratireducens]
MSLSLTVHRGTQQIGGSCIEIEAEGERLILDAGRPLEAPRDATDLLPDTLNRERPATVLISHPHMDHWGLIGELPPHWKIMTGEKSAELMRLTEGLFGGAIDREIKCWNSRSGPFDIGPFRITPFLTDHSAFDAYMLFIEAVGSSLLYTGDFRTHGRKASLVEGTIERLTGKVDLLLMEGTNLGSDKPVITERELEDRFVDLARTTKGQVYVQWSAQNIDRTVTLYRAAIRSARKLVIDAYAADVLNRVAEGTRIMRPGARFDRLRVLILPSGKRLFHRGGRSDAIDAMARQPEAISRRLLKKIPSIVMLRDSMLRDFENAGISFTSDDAYAFSNWRGYLDPDDENTAWAKADAAGANTLHLHTSGHASASELCRFAEAIAPKWLVPVHGIKWDDPEINLPPVQRLQGWRDVDLRWGLKNLARDCRAVLTGA